MRILIDECLNWRLSRALIGHYAVSAQKMGRGGLKNGPLLTDAEKEFDVFLAGDPTSACSYFRRIHFFTTLISARTFSRTWGSPQVT
jgi:hypothetical protein